MQSAPTSPRPSLPTISVVGERGGVPAVGEVPASVSLARGFMFVVFEQLPEVGGGKIIRKVAVIPKDFSLLPANPLGTLSPAEHAINVNPTASPWLSGSSKPFGAPSMKGEPLLIDLDRAQAAGARIVSPQELVAELRRFVAANPAARPHLERLMWAVERVEGEVLVKGEVPGKAVSTASVPHKAYMKSAEELWEAFTQRKIGQAELESELAALEKAYGRARILGRVGRVLTVVGIVITVKEVAQATQRSAQQRSFKPLGAETVRQLGGWGGSLAGAKIGFLAGAAFGIETGPGALISGALGAIVFGAIGYFGADLIADQISPN
jgi:hypothetical protein